ncbi:MvdC/MvdD family ATP grasp protein [Taibaiella chishuiensis]|uniref:RimK-like ATP-grasp domain-containing protein n=1 Tax=Taibaiella chishuiensis TaxID=1434707 RepID=A0A2P8DBX3_9BACT|nr:MvdD family ATP-grasp ribosomal peptide maturase [Taibaiella chishuiensis]PSK94716.1 RimK-like ATP-grasp domain-containing protein [Taibaiella chishuiensis]
MQKILIITHSQDNECIDIVTGKLEAQGAQVIRFNVDRYPLAYGLSSCYENGVWHTYLDYEGKRENLGDITALWYRRSHNLASGLKEQLEGEYLSSAHGEIRQTLFGMLEGMHCFQIGRFSQYRRLDSKEEQMKIASALGLKVPETCITNSPEEARRFVLAHKEGAIVKMQSSFAIYREGREHVVFTNVITEDNLDSIDSLQYCPMQFQQKIEKARELRVTIVGDAVFTFAVDSQQMDNAKVDWRREGLELLAQWEPYELPADVREKLLRLMDIYGANYGAIDIIVTPENEYYFLEINSAGEYFWLDRLADHKISEQIADVLLGKVFRRYHPLQLDNKLQTVAAIS